MKIDVKESSLVRPAEPTPQTCLWVSNLEAIYLPGTYVPTCYFYGSNGSDNFFDSTPLKAALGRTLVHFHPMAGRLKMDSNNRLIEIDCNGEGALFVEAEADCVMEDLGDFISANLGRGFTPVVDRSQGISACPLLLVQVTRFKCGGVCLGIAIEHHLTDGISGLHFVNSWSQIACGHTDNDIIVPPFFDKRAVLSARDPPQPKFPHIEYQPPPKMNNDSPPPTLVPKRLRLTRDQVMALKAKCKNNNEEEGNDVRYSSFEVLAAHFWRCAVMAWQLPEDQETRLRIPVDGRSRLRQPELPRGYFGSVVFQATPIGSAGELCSNSLKFAANKVHEAIARVDSEYMRSAIDYLELQPDPTIIGAKLFSYKCPNIMFNSWARLPFYDADFGWGRPAYVGRAGPPPHVGGHLLPTDDGSAVIGLCFHQEQIECFEKLFYDI